MTLTTVGEAFARKGLLGLLSKLVSLIQVAV